MVKIFNDSQNERPFFLFLISIALNISSIDYILANAEDCKPFSFNVFVNRFDAKVVMVDNFI